MLNLDLPQTALLDGGMGRELRFRGVNILDTIWSATGLLIAPESITTAIPELVETGVNFTGGYANTFKPVPEDWTLDGYKQTDGLLELRSDLDPNSYAKYVVDWLHAGATVIGGCCGTRPAHIARLREMLDETETLK